MNAWRYCLQLKISHRTVNCWFRLMNDCISIYDWRCLWVNKCRWGYSPNARRLKLFFYSVSGEENVIVERRLSKDTLLILLLHVWRRICSRYDEDWANLWILFTIERFKRDWRYHIGLDRASNKTRNVSPEICILISTKRQKMSNQHIRPQRVIHCFPTRSLRVWSLAESAWAITQRGWGFDVVLCPDSARQIESLQSVKLLFGKNLHLWLTRL